MIFFFFGVCFHWILYYNSARSLDALSTSLLLNLTDFCIATFAVFVIRFHLLPGVKKTHLLHKDDPSHLYIYMFMSIQKVIYFN